MSKTAKKATAKKPSEKQPMARPSHPALDLMLGHWQDLAMAAIFNVMRVLKAVNLGDAYYENYLSMRERYGAKFFDTYQLLWKIGVTRPPKRILEIGTRTGISICQLLSSMDKKALEALETVVCVDPFDNFTSPALVRKNLKHLNLPHGEDKVTIHAVKSEDYFREAEGAEFDFILVDGDHGKEPAREDLDEAVHLVAQGGIIVFDDISTNPGECALRDVWDAWKKENADDFYFAEIMEGKGVAWAVKK